MWLALLPAASIRAAEPAPAGLAQAVDEATHIVVGTVRQVSVVSFYNDILYRLNPEPRMLASYTAAQMQLDIDEVLHPAGWWPDRGVKYLAGGGLYTVAQIREATVGKRLIFFMRAQEGNKIVDRDLIFFATPALELGLPVRYEAAVKRLIDARRAQEKAREEKQKGAGAPAPAH